MVVAEDAGRDFLGRERERALLLDTWTAVRNGPAVALLSGPTGRGKTRLVQEFYRCIAADQAEPYGTGALDDSLAAAPDRGGDTVPSWLWFAVRCIDPDAYGYDGTSLRPLETLRAQAWTHLQGVYASVARRDRRNKAARAALTLLATFGLPGSGTAVEIGTRIAQALDDGLEPIEVTGDLLRYGRDVSHAIGGRDPEVQAASFDAELVAGLRALVQNLAAPDGRPLPIVIVVDDAHWCDAHTVSVLDSVIRHAHDENWPLMLIVCSWDDELDSAAGRARSTSPELARFVSTVQEREALRPHLTFQPIPLEPLEKSKQVALIAARVPTFPREQYGILVERSQGDLQLLEDYCTELASTPEWRDPEGRIIVPDADLQRLPATKADMARMRLRSAGADVGELLAMGSAQGWKFYGLGTSAMARARGHEPAAVEDLLERADRPHRLCAVALHEVLGHSAEFRAYPYYEASRRSFDRMRDRANLLRALATALREHYQRDGFSDLAAIDRVEVLQDLALAGRELELRFDPDWRDCLDDCALDLAEAQRCLGHLPQARATAHEVLANAGDESDRGQRALAILCDAASVLEDAEEQSLLDRWWQVPEARRSAEAFVRRARREIRTGRGDAAVRTLDRLLARDPHTTAERLSLELERARALCYSDDAAGAPLVIASVEAAAAVGARDDPEFALRLDHVAYIAAHNLEHNDDAARRAQSSMKRYEDAGLREGYLLSKINLGDARWGTGPAWRALPLLRSVCAETAKAVFPHPKALAALCLANALAADDPAAADEHYERGIAEAQRAGWKYDELYGGIYRCLLASEQEGSAGDALRALGAEARGHRLAYLADVAAGYAAMQDVVAGRAPQGVDEVLLRNAAPLGQVYAAAAAVSGSARSRVDAREALFDLLRRIQGLKGRPQFVIAAAEAAATTPPERELADALALRFRP